MTLHTGWLCPTNSFLVSLSPKLYQWSPLICQYCHCTFHVHGPQAHLNSMFAKYLIMCREQGFENCINLWFWVLFCDSWLKQWVDCNNSIDRFVSFLYTTFLYCLSKSHVSSCHLMDKYIINSWSSTLLSAYFMKNVKRLML
jgi:hypothetical protein